MKFDSIVNELKLKIDIVTVISNFLPLTKKNNNYWAICPFHNDSKPSMSVSQDKQIYHCFSCNAGGNVFKFIMEYKKVGFRTAVIEASKIANVALPVSFINVHGSNDKLDSVISANNMAKTFYILNLKSHNQNELTKFAKKYLISRGITDELVNTFQLGIAFDNNGLTDFLLSQNISKKVLISSGLANTTNDYSRFFDFFTNRLIIPIFDSKNNCIGFSGRTFDNNVVPKYLNSRESIAFNKSRILYNLQNAVKYINKLNTIIIVEGFMDLFALHKVGVKNVVATMGTNLTTKHASILNELNTSVNLFFDGDNPGIKATLKSAFFLMSKKIKVKIINNTTNSDPDELINVKKISKKELDKILSNQLDPMRFAINYFSKKIDLSDFGTIDYFKNKMFEYLAMLNSIIEQQYYLSEISKIINIPLDIVLSEYEQQFLGSSIRNKNNRQRNNDDKTLTKKSGNLLITQQYELELLIKRVKECELYILLKMLSSNKYCKVWAKSHSNFSTPAMTNLAYLIDDVSNHHDLESMDFSKKKQIIAKELDDKIEELTILTSLFNHDYQNQLLSIIHEPVNSGKSIQFFQDVLKSTVENNRKVYKMVQERQKLIEDLKKNTTKIN